MWPFDGLNSGTGAQQPGTPSDPNYFQRLNTILQAQRAGGTPGGLLNPPNLGQPNPGQIGPPAPGSQNNPLQSPGFDLGQPNPGQYGPPAPGSQNNPQPSLWSNLMGALGKIPPQLGGGPGAMPGGTIGMPAGATQMAPPLAAPSPLPQGQMQAPAGMGAYFRSLQFPQQPAAGGGGNPMLMAQYMALQQLMRGS